jgi:hypothetical protein|tara:strand:+ start:616 stop:963 length:348 start_codon:yes stop_codon:yes gene_type:complete
MPEDYGNFWKDVLQYEPQAAYFSAAPFGTRATAANPFGGGYSPASQRYWSGQYGNVMNQYVGEAGRRMRAGQDPSSMSFFDYLEQYPWTERYSSISPLLRGGGVSRFNPSARYMY